MGKSSPKPPPAPDPTVVANAQSAANIATAQEQQRLNMINSVGPDGSVNYSADATAPGGYRQTTTLSPGQQGLYDQTLALSGGALNTAQQALAGANTALGNTLTPPQLQNQAGYSQEMADSVWNQAKQYLDPVWNQGEDRSRTRLANQGFSQNSTGYDSAMDDFYRGKGLAYNDAAYRAQQAGASQGLAEGTFANQAAQQGFQNEATAQNMPINQLGALLSLGQVQQPGGVSYSPTAVGNTDVLGAYGLQQAQLNANYQAAQQKQNGLLGGLFQLGAAGIQAFSDVRLKRAIRRVGEWKGYALYAFKYLWDDTEHRGVMAQDVLKTKPEAVMRMSNGYLAVNYGAL